MSTVPAPWVAAPPAPIMPQPERPLWHVPAATLGPPQAAGHYISRAVSDAPVRPVAYTRPVTISAPGPVGLPLVRAIVDQACAGRARDVEVIARGPSSLMVRLKVRQAADAEYLANTISRLPELGPYQVLFEMQVAPLTRRNSGRRMPA